MDGENDAFSTTLAYTKSPKTTKRTSFQDELKKALNARVSRQQAIEESENSDYSEEFESDDSLDESDSKKNAFDFKAKKTHHNFHVSDDDDDLPKKVSFLKMKNQFNRPVDTESEKNKDHYENGQLKSHPFDERKKDRQIIDDKESKPTPKPRETRLKSPTSSQGISVSNESLKPTPQQRTLLKKNSFTEDKDSARAEETYSSTKYTSLSAPSSITRLNDKSSAPDTPAFTERLSPEGYKVSSQPSMDSKFKSHSLSLGEHNLTISRQGSQILQDLNIQANESHRVSESRDNDRKSPSVLELMLATVNEKSKPQDDVDTSVQGTDGNLLFDQQKMFQQKHERDENSVLVTSDSSRSLTSQQRSKKSAKHSTQMSAKSRYLGTLTVLDKSINENGNDLEPADVLRATVYQNWLEKKKVFLQELNKIRKSEEEQKKNKISKAESSKKEEATAAFQAWKSDKKKDIKTILMKQKEEEEKNMREIQDIARRQEEAKRAFEKWKENKEEYLKEKLLTEKQIEMEKKRKAQKNVMEKKQDNVSAIKTWNVRKEEVLKQKKKESISEKLKQEKLKAKKEEQERKAMEIYEEWLEKKEKHDRIEKKQKKLQVILEDDTPPPWSPPGKTIPTGK
ncbi:microtubule-associated protein 9 [Pelodytes ibericus]